MAKKKNQKQETSHTISAPKRLGWMFLAGVWLLIFAALFSFSPMDPPSHAMASNTGMPKNWCGHVGAWVAYKLYLMVGQGVWVLMAGALAYLLTTAFGKKVDQLPLRTIGTFVMAISTSGFIAMIAPEFGPLPEGSGGLVAIAAIDQLMPRFSYLGTFVILLMTFGVGITLAADELLLTVPRCIAAVGRWCGTLDWSKPVTASGHAIDKMRKTIATDETAEAAPPRKPWFLRRNKTKEDELAIHEDAGGIGGIQAFDPEVNQGLSELKSAKNKSNTKLKTEPAPEPVDEKHVVLVEEVEETEEDAPEQNESGETDLASEEAEDTKKSTHDEELDAIRARLSKLPISVASHQSPAKPLAQPKQDLSGYKFPSLDVLSEPESNFSDEMEKMVRDQAESLEHALQLYKIDAQVVEIDAGPAITLYEVKMAPGSKVAAINKVASDIARELKSQNIRVVPNTAGKSTVGVEVPNIKKEKVRLKELMHLGGQKTLDKMRLPMYLGKDASGNPLIADLAKLPHMLIAGTTGSGKSVCINTIIMSFLLTRRPDQVKLILVDPKMVEMAQFRDIPHLMCPVVTEMNKAAAILEWAVTKMDERYALLAEAGVRDLESYNALDWADLKERMNIENPEDEAAVPRKLPRMVFIIDELADLMITNKEVEQFIARLAGKARAVGLHLILATQRPSANVITGLIKSNMPARLSFQVASGMDSRIVLDAKGAELLLGQGDMLYMAPGTNKLQRAQGTLVDDIEVRNVVRFLKGVASQSFAPDLIQLKAPGAGDADILQDDLFDRSVRIILDTRRGSVSLLQRKLGIGYSRASKIIEQMEEFGILGPHKTAQARECLITLEDWEAMVKHAASLAAEHRSMNIDHDADPEGDIKLGHVLPDPPAIVDDYDDEDLPEAVIEPLPVAKSGTNFKPHALESETEDIEADAEVAEDDDVLEIASLESDEEVSAREDIDVDDEEELEVEDEEVMEEEGEEDDEDEYEDEDAEYEEDDEDEENDEEELEYEEDEDLEDEDDDEELEYEEEDDEEDEDDEEELEYEEDDEDEDEDDEDEYLEYEDDSEEEEDEDDESLEYEEYEEDEDEDEEDEKA